MQSVADVIYSHVNHVEPVEAEMIDMFFMSIRKETQKTLDDIDEEIEVRKKVKFDSYVLRPKYVAFIQMKQHKFGNMSKWSDALKAKIDKEFMERYIDK